MEDRRLTVKRLSRYSCTSGRAAFHLSLAIKEEPVKIHDMHSSELYDKATALAFYEERYASRGYMEEWPSEKKRRVFEMIRSLGLPDEGEAVDFGCGSGVFTEVLKQALPSSWRVHGIDISESAIDQAKTRCPDCLFFLPHDRALAGKKFDFLFTHHVLEHVSDLPQALDEINDRLKAAAAMLHILPCGNEGSFEHAITLLRTDGIDASLENRFFFEDVGHVRRLTSAGLSELCRKRGFLLKEESYSNQRDGAIEWITQSGSDFIRMLTDTAAAVNGEARSKLKELRFRLLTLSQLRQVVLVMENRLAKTHKTLRTYIGLLLLAPLYVFSKPVDLYVKWKSQHEWTKRRKERNGSEMYLFFRR